MKKLVLFHHDQTRSDDEGGRDPAEVPEGNRRARLPLSSALLPRKGWSWNGEEGALTISRFVAIIHPDEESMAFAFKPSDIRKLEKTFGVHGAQRWARTTGLRSRRRIRIAEARAGRSIRTSPSGHQRGAWYPSTRRTRTSSCTSARGMWSANLLGEVTFVAEQDGKLSGLIIEREGGCSLFANVDRSLVSGDFTAARPGGDAVRHRAVADRRDPGIAGASRRSGRQDAVAAGGSKSVARMITVQVLNAHAKPAGHRVRC